MKKSLSAARCRVHSTVKRGIFLIALIALPGVNVSADVYKWIDKDGKVQFGDKPPQDLDSEHINIESATAPDRAEDGKSRQEHLLEPAGKATEHGIDQPGDKSAAKQIDRGERTAREQRCLEARMQLEVLQEQLPVYRDEAGHFRAKWKYDSYHGKREYLDDATRATELRQVRLRITTHCQHPDDAGEQIRARMQWIKAERCAAARADLTALEQPAARATRQAREEKRLAVGKFCK